MKRVLLLVFLIFTFGARGQDASSSALRALKALPPEQSRRVAIIEGRQGTPAPDQWHFLVYDPAQENGLLELVVAGKQIVASHSVSQFADELKPEDVVGFEGVQVDSDRLYQLAERYAVANLLKLAGVNYRLDRNGAGAVPVWKITCLDEGGRQLAVLRVLATNGAVISNEGFAFSPGAMPESTTVMKAEKVSDGSGQEPVRRTAAVRTSNTTRPSRSTASRPPQTPVRLEPIAERSGGLFGRLRGVFSSNR